MGQGLKVAQSPFLMRSTSKINVFNDIKMDKKVVAGQPNLAQLTLNK